MRTITARDMVLVVESILYIAKGVPRGLPLPGRERQLDDTPNEEEEENGRKHSNFIHHVCL